MTSASLHRFLRPLLFGTFMLGCFVTVIFTYFKPSTSWLLGPVGSSASTGDVLLFSNESNEKVTTILIWFGSGSSTVCSSVFNTKGCFITADKKFYSKADAVIIFHKRISDDLSNLPQLRRPPFQKWVWMNFLSPSNTRKLPGIKNMFNLTLNYRQDADITTPFGSLVAVAGNESFVLPSKNKLVCWIVSHWSERLVRVGYYNELKKHIKIHGYGEAFREHLPKEDFFSTIASCKFYLSFENSIEKDYITEKLYNPLSVGTVPVVLGPPRQRYENLIQGDSFIHVDDFASPKELADYLLLLDKNDEMYLRYFQWRQHFIMRKNKMNTEYACMACDYLRKHKEQKSVINLEEWYWG